MGDQDKQALITFAVYAALFLWVVWSVVTGR